MLKTLRFMGFGALALGLLAASPAFAQETDDDVRKELEALKQGQQQIRKQLNEIKRLLQQQQRPQPAGRQGPEVKDVVFQVGANEIKGARDAGLTLIEFTDYQ